ncbi:hypothetical protein LguiA_026821 [Lonicera macranthoides]
MEKVETEDWSQLPRDLLVSITNCFSVFEDIVLFSSVCSSCDLLFFGNINKTAQNDAFHGFFLTNQTTSGFLPGTRKTTNTE